MMTIPGCLQAWLKKQPEYGMGYQIGVAKLSTGSSEHGVILNGTIFAQADELRPMSADEVSKAVAMVHESSLSIVNINLIARSPESLRGVRRIHTLTAKSAPFSAANESVRASQGAKDAPITATVAGELFKRFSPYVDDIRITENRGLQPGTFATTAEDAENVKTGRDAVIRYALENKKSANKRFTITPSVDTRLQRGIVQPAYGEPGGGVEVIFVDGTCDYSVTGPDILPE
jgi:hypothetical protein